MFYSKYTTLEQGKKESSSLAWFQQSSCCVIFSGYISFFRHLIVTHLPYFSENPRNSVSQGVWLWKQLNEQLYLHCKSTMDSSPAASDFISKKGNISHIYSAIHQVLRLSYHQFIGKICDACLPECKLYTEEYEKQGGCQGLNFALPHPPVHMWKPFLQCDCFQDEPLKRQLG